MGKYYAIYKCPMCSKEFRTTDKPTEIKEDDIPKLLAGVVKNQQFLGSALYQAPIYAPHKCDNGDGGLAQLIGLRKIREE